MLARTLSVRTWAPTTPNVRGVASLGCGATVRGVGWPRSTAGVRACGREARAPHCAVSLRATCRLRMGAQYVQVAVRSGKGEESSHRSRVTSLQVQHCLRGGKCAIAIIALVCYSSGGPLVFLSLFRTQFPGWCGHRCGDVSPFLYGSCSSVWEYLARCNCWFPGVATVSGYLCSMGQDALCEVGSTVRCVFKACFTVLRKKPFFEISPTLSLLPSAMPQLGPRCCIWNLR